MNIGDAERTAELLAAVKGVKFSPTSEAWKNYRDEMPIGVIQLLARIAEMTSDYRRRWSIAWAAGAGLVVLLGGLGLTTGIIGGLLGAQALRTAWRARKAEQLLAFFAVRLGG